MRTPKSPLIGAIPRDTFERVDAVLAFVAETQGNSASDESVTARYLLLEACREALSFELRGQGHFPAEDRA